MAVSKRLRYEILRRDANTCRYCGAKAPDVPLRVDHVTPVALGGSDHPTNLVTACEPCNSGKTSSSPDATLVADVSSDALRWAAAMAQAVESLKAEQAPKAAYRESFNQAWNEWAYTYQGKKETFDLPAGWKGSLDTFREAGLPREVWPDIIEKAMTNPTVKANNTFRYCCGIAWRMVGELQERAKSILGVEASEGPEANSIVQAAMDVWAADRDGDVDAEHQERFRASVTEALQDEEAHRVIEAAQQASWYGEDTAQGALASLDRAEALQAWSFAWLTKTDEWPSDEYTERVRADCDALFAAHVSRERVLRAAIYAGSRRSVRLYFGLSKAELGEINESEAVARTVEIWVEAFRASSDRWPTDEERTAFFASLRRIGVDPDGFWMVDLYQAASAAGAYQDTDMSTCLPRHLSVFQAAANPLQGAAT